MLDGAVLLLAEVALPGPILAATPTRNPLEPISEPPVEPMSTIAGPVVTVAVVLGLVAAVVLLGFVIARIGGQREVSPAPGVSPPPRFLARSPIGRGIALIIAVSALAIGALLGNDVAKYLETGGFAMLGAYIWIVTIVVGIVGLTAPAVVAWLVRRRRMSPAIATLLVAGVLLGTGAIGGAGAFGLARDEREPVEFQAPGRVRVEIRGASPPFTARIDAAAECSSVADDRSVGSVSALDVGELGSGTVRASISLVSSADQVPSIDLFVDGGDLPEGSEQPFWSGPLLVIQAAADTGRASFEGVDRVAEPDPPPSTGTDPWPDSLSGTITWTCDPWP